MSTPEFFFVESLGDLYKTVQSQKLFPDPKYFVDCTPRDDPQTILADYEKLKDQQGFDLNLFISTHFFHILPNIKATSSTVRPIGPIES